MFVNELEKMHWIATERRTRLLQEAAVARLYAQPAPVKLLSVLTTAISGWFSGGKSLRALPLHRLSVDA